MSLGNFCASVVSLINNNSGVICTTEFTAALFTATRTQKQPKCSSTEKWIKKMWYTYTMEYYAVIKKNNIESFAEMDPETVI